MSNLQQVPTDRRCNAKTRAGTLCKNWGMRNGRCRMHGGKSYGGYASPRLKHGWYSNYFPFCVWRSEILYQERLRRSVKRQLRELGLDERLADEVMRLPHALWDTPWSALGGGLTNLTFCQLLGRACEKRRLRTERYRPADSEGRHQAA